MNEILDVLKASSFTESKWFELGLTLGLKKPTLDSINDKYKEDPSRCLRECLSKWLQQADEVQQPSFVTLASALRQVDCKPAADKAIETSKSTKNIHCT